MGWTAGTEGDLYSISPPRGESIIQISTYRGPPDDEASAAELELRAGVFLRRLGWPTEHLAARRVRAGYFALDAEGPIPPGRSIIGFRAWRGWALLLTYNYPASDEEFVAEAKACIDSIEPETDNRQAGRIFGGRSN